MTDIRWTDKEIFNILTWLFPNEDIRVPKNEEREYPIQGQADTDVQ